MTLSTCWLGRSGELFEDGVLGGAGTVVTIVQPSVQEVLLAF